MDYIFGVTSIGAKTAIGLIKSFGSLDNFLQNLDDLAEKQRNLITEKKGDALLSKELVTIKTDIDLDMELEKFRYEGFDKARLRALFDELEFKNLLRELGDGGGPVEKPDENRAVPYDYYSLILTEDGLDRVIGRIKETGEVSIDLETTSTDPMLAEIVGRI